MLISAVLPELALDGLAPRHFPGLLGGQPLDSHWAPAETGISLDPPCMAICFFLFLSHLPFSSESPQISVKSLQRLTWNLKGIEILSAGTLFIALWSVAAGWGSSERVS